MCKSRFHFSWQSMCKSRFYFSWQSMCKSRRFCPSLLCAKVSLSLSFVVSFQCIKSKDYTYPLLVRKDVKHCIWYCKWRNKWTAIFVSGKVILHLESWCLAGGFTLPPRTSRCTFKVLLMSETTLQKGIMWGLSPSQVHSISDFLLFFNCLYKLLE